MQTRQTSWRLRTQTRSVTATQTTATKSQIQKSELALEWRYKDRGCGVAMSVAGKGASVLQVGGWKNLFFFHRRAVEMTMDYTGDKDRTELWQQSSRALPALMLDALWGRQSSVGNKTEMDGDKLLTCSIHTKRFWQDKSVFSYECGLNRLYLRVFTLMHYFSLGCQTSGPPESFSSIIYLGLCIFSPPLFICLFWLDGSRWFTATLILHLYHCLAVALSSVPRVSNVKFLRAFFDTASTSCGCLWITHSSAHKALVTVDLVMQHWYCYPKHF